MNGKKFLIIGGGICGLSLGWYLARAGAAVSILEQGEAGHGATWASAGMLAAQLEAEPGEERLLTLLLDARGRWRTFAAELEKASASGVDYRTEGTLMVGLNSDDERRLKYNYEYMLAKGLQVEWVSSQEVRRLEPHLSRSVVSGIFSPLDHQVDSRKVALALRAAFLKSGGDLREHTPVESIEIEGGGVRGVRVAESILEADHVVLAAGAWSGTIPGLQDGVRPPVRPVRGQMLALQMQPDSPLLQHVVWGPDAYLVPRRDGRLLVGATVEEAGFDTGLTAGGILHLLRGAWELLPGVHDLNIAETWSGLRPGSRDDAPILGPSGVRGLAMATGHYRNGILLAPVTATAVGEYLLTGELPDIAKPFTLERFKA